MNYTDDEMQNMLMGFRPADAPIEKANGPESAGGVSGAAGLLSALRDWRTAEKRHGLIALGILSGDMDDAGRVLASSLRALRIQADKTLSADNATSAATRHEN